MYDHPYLRWQLGEGRRWSTPAATVAAKFRDDRVGLVAVGDPEEHPALVDKALADLRAEGHESFRVSAHPDAAYSLPVRAARGRGSSYWEWMLTNRPCDDGSGDVEWLGDEDLPAIARLIDTHSPRAHARPGDQDIIGWAGARHLGDLAAVGAMVDSSAGHPHLRGIAVADAYRGRGLGRAVSAFLTRAGLDRDEAVSLSMYSDNDVARRMYRRLGYETHARFASFEVANEAMMDR